MKKIIYVLIVVLAFMAGQKVNLLDLSSSNSLNSDTIAIVNNDQTVSYNDQDYNFGNDFVRLINNSNSSFDYQVVPSYTSIQGMDSGKYAASMRISSNLTSSILSVNEVNPIQTQITYEISSFISEDKKSLVISEIESQVDSFRSQVVYMYLYALFDGLHDTQEQIVVVAKNNKPVYTFIEQLTAINIITNSEYELLDNNDDSFLVIDISEDKNSFIDTIETYNQEVASIVRVYEEENDIYKSEIDSAFDSFSDTNDDLIDNIDNVYDLLDEIVRDNLDYTEEEYSLTDSRLAIQNIILTYLLQLKDLNYINDSNNILVENGFIINQQLDNLSNNSLINQFEEFITSRFNYYSSLKLIEGCLEDNSCSENDINNFDLAYSDYQTSFDAITQEQKYYDKLSYYLHNIDDETTESDSHESDDNVSAEIIDIQEQKLEITKDNDLTIQQYNNFGDTNFVEFDFNLNTYDDIIIDGIKLKDIESVELISTSEYYNVDLEKGVLNNYSINLTDIDTNYISLVFKVKSGDDGAIDLDYLDQSYHIDFLVDSNISFDAEIVQSSDKSSRYSQSLKFNIDYVIGEDTPSEYEFIFDDLLFTDYIIESDIDNVVVFENGFSLNNSDLDIGTVVHTNIVLSYNYNIADYQVISYMVGTNEFDLLVDGNTLYMSTPSITVSDDPYNDDNKAEDNDVDHNSDFESDEQIGIRLSFDLSSQYLTNLSNISFDLETKLLEYFEITDVTINGDSYLDDFVVNDNRIEVSLIEDVKMIPNDIYNIRIYINSKIIPNIDDYTDFISVGDFEFILDEYSYSIEAFNSRKLVVSRGNVNLDSVVYTLANEESCTANNNELIVEYDNKVCMVEAGEQISKQIIISNDSDEIANNIQLINEYDPIFDYINTDIRLESTIGDDVSFYENEIIESIEEFKLPPHSVLTITYTIDVDESIIEDVNILDKFVLGQFSENKFVSSLGFSVSPNDLQIQNVTVTEKAADGIWSVSEPVNIVFELKNNSSRSTYKINGFALENSITSGLNTTYDIITIEDNNWNQYEIDNSQEDDFYISNFKIKPQEMVRITIQIRLSDITTSKHGGHISIYPLYTNDYIKGTPYEVDYAISSASYFELAQDLIENGVVNNDNSYNDALENTNKVIDYISKLLISVDNLEGFNSLYSKYISIIDSYTVLDNDLIDSIISNINEFGLGYTDRDDDDYHVEYEYCIENNELSCLIFNLYNDIYSKEEIIKAYYLNLLRTIDPSIQSNSILKPNTIGNYYNGRDICIGGTSSDLCVDSNDGILKQKSTQSSNIENFFDKTQLLLNTTLGVVNNDPYKVTLNLISESMQQKMDDVELFNNELFSLKLDIYDENYNIVNNYLNDVSNDDSYIKLTNAFNEEETARQSESESILNNIYGLLPNTMLDGLPNKTVYSFIAKPIYATMNKEDSIFKAIENEYQQHYIIIIFLALIIIVLGGIYYYLRRKDE